MICIKDSKCISFLSQVFPCKMGQSFEFFLKAPNLLDKVDWVLKGLHPIFQELGFFLFEEVIMNIP